jgi:asparagine synthase (glutamine-hydrolysing)
MCGIAGILGRQRSDAGRAAGALRHRGPDDEGAWSDGDVSLTHRRLAVVGLGESGTQPMHSASGRRVLIFNGEIYNFVELRRELDPMGLTWRGDSDSEVLVEAIDAWGVEETLKRAVGMFAFAVWDREVRRLSLARDRLGEKPLYFATTDTTFAFASELSALTAMNIVGLDADAVSEQGLKDLLLYGTTRGPRAILRDVHKLPPASLLEIEAENLGAAQPPRRYWALNSASGSLGRLPKVSAKAAVELVDEALTLSVRQQMVADVPLGAFLSGGIDSSLVVAKMVEASHERIQTFSIGFDSPDFDEAPFARAVAEQLGTDHTERYVGEDDLLAMVPMLPFVGGEPFADPSFLPTLLVCALARERVTVALSGDGADELFAGYDRYPLSLRLERIPAVLRRMAARGARVIDHAAPWGALEARVRRDRRPGRHKWDLTSSRLRQLRSTLIGPTAAERYHGLLRSPFGQSTDDGDPAGAPSPGAWLLGSHLDAMLLDDLEGYLVDDILVKIDRAAMHVSLETRMPFLDHRVVEAAWMLAHDALIRDGRRKWVLREILSRYVPPSLTERPKAGFGVPLGPWLRGPLRPWAEALLAERALKEHGLLETAAVRRLWADHIERRTDRSRELWPVLMFQGWLLGKPRSEGPNASAAGRL